MQRATRLALPLLLPEVTDGHDACTRRLVRLLERRDGVRGAHIVEPGQILADEPPGADGIVPPPADGRQLCVHYDPDRLTPAAVDALAYEAGARVTTRFGHAVVPFHSVGAEDEGRRLEDALRALPGVRTAAVNYAGQVARVEFDRRRTNLETIELRLREAGAPPQTASATPPPREGWYSRNRELAWSLASGILLTIGWTAGRFAAAPATVTTGVFIAAYFFGAKDNVGHFLADLRHRKFHFNIDLLMLVAAAGAAALGAWTEGALLLFLFSLGHALEHYALGRARNAISALGELAPQSAAVLRDGRESKVPISDVKPGDRVVVKPAERIPVDGIVREGRSSVNQAPITGESMPEDKAPGEQVFAGSVNGEGALVIEVTAAIGDRTLDRVIRLVAEAQTQKAPTQRFTDRFARIFVPVVIIADVLLIAIPPALGVWTLEESFYRAMALLVAASPCALALGTPAAVLSGIAQAARKGVLIKGGAYLEMLGGIQVLALDKTGTITLGEPSVTDLRPVSGVSEDTLLSTAAAVEARSQHPLARAIVDAAARGGLEVPRAGDLESVTGRGIRSTINGESVEAGRLLMFEEQGLAVPESMRAAIAELEQAGRSTVIVRHAGEGWLGVIGVADRPHPGMRETLDLLRRIGIRRIVMLTGDNAGAANAIGRAIGLDEVRAGLLPDDKVTAIRELAHEGRVAMVGDGVNDAPALAHATVGIAMGGAGTAVALETADVALMGDDLGRLPFAIGLSRQARRIIRQNLILSLGVIALLVVATTTGMIGIGPAVIAHEGSTIVVIANALRLLAFGNRTQG